MSSTYVQFRIDEKDKKEASEILNSLGTNLSAVLNMTIKQIILQRRIPFDVALPEHSEAVEYAAATLAMEGMPFDEQGKQMLEHFNQMSPKEQDHNLQKLLTYYKEKAAEKENQHA
jgi:addiction module RelB/DinJ family antitoxin